MTIDRVAMKELLEKGSDQDLLREMLAFVAARMMDVEVESLTGAAHGERSPERTNQRNGYRTREWHTGVGTVPVAIPKLRKSTYFPSFLEPRRSADKAMIANRGCRTGRMERRRRSTACQVPQALRAHGRRRARGARLHGLQRTFASAATSSR